MADTVLPMRPPGSHPTPEQLYRARHGPRTAEAERWIAHAVACAACSEELLRQEAFDAPQPEGSDSLAAAWKRFGKAPPRAPLAPVLPISRVRPILPAPPTPRRRPAAARWILAAALAATVVGLGAWSQTQAPHAALSDPDGSGAWRPAGVLNAPPLEILFPSPAGAAPRSVTVFNVSRSYSWTSPPAAGGRISFPEAERRKLRPGVDYFWTVAGGQTVSPRSFRLR